MCNDSLHMHPIFLIASAVNVMFKLSDFTHFWPMFPFFIPWQQQKIFGFPVFSGEVSQNGLIILEIISCTLKTIYCCVPKYLFPCFVEYSKIVGTFQILCLLNLV